MLLGIVGWAHVAYASQGGFIQLPQALVQDLPSKSAHVPVADPASGAQLTGELTATMQAIRVAASAQDASGQFPRKSAALALVPSQSGARSSDLMTTGSGAFGIVAEEAAAAGAYGTAKGTGETRAVADPAAAAPYFDGAAGSRAGALLIPASSTGTTQATKPAKDEKPEPGQSDNGADKPPEKKPEFSGSAAQAGPDLDASEEKDVILNGWK